MSHFAVLVIGHNVEGQLARFDENMEVEGYREDVEQKELERMLEFYKTEGKPAKKRAAANITFDKDGVANDHAWLNKLYQDWNGRELFHDSQGYYNICTYNPDSKWDWYMIGGRWTGYFKAKEGYEGVVGTPGVMTDSAKPGWYDQILKKDVDVDFMTQQAADEAAARYDKYTELVKGLEVPPSWEKVREKYGTERIEEARAEYHDTPYMKALKAANFLGWDEAPEKFQCTKEVFVQRARNSALTPFAVLMNGQWYERGEMGWWGIVSNEKDRDEWNAQFAKMFNELPDDTLLTIVDCHI